MPSSSALSNYDCSRCPASGSICCDCCIHGDFYAPACNSAPYVQADCYPATPSFIFPADSTSSTEGWGFGPWGQLQWTTDRCGQPAGAMALRDRFFMTSTSLAPTGDTPRTLSAWVRCSAEGSMEFLGSGYVECSRRFGLMSVNQRMYFVGHCNDQDTSTRICDGTWHHTAVTYASGVLKMYDQGILVSTSTDRGFDTAPSFFRIGWNGYPPMDSDYKEAFTGDVDDVRAYNAALSENAIFNLSMSTCITPYAFSTPSPTQLPSASSLPDPTLAALPDNAISRVPSLLSWLRPDGLLAVNGSCSMGSPIQTWASSSSFEGGETFYGAVSLLFAPPVRAIDTATGLCIARFTRAADTLLVMPAVDLSTGPYSITIVARMRGPQSHRILSKFSSSYDWFMGWYGGCQVS